MIYFPRKLTGALRVKGGSVELRVLIIPKKFPHVPTFLSLDPQAMLGLTQQINHNCSVYLDSVTIAPPTAAGSAPVVFEGVSYLPKQA